MDLFVNFENSFDVINEDVTDKLKKLAKGINDGNMQIAEVITIFKNFLTSTDQKKRANGVELLSIVLSNLSVDVLADKELNELIDFFINRLKDQSSVVLHSALSLMSLVEMSNFNFTMAQKIFHAMHNDSNINVLEPKTRVELFRLLQLLMQKFLSDFIQIPSTFIRGFLIIVYNEMSSTCLRLILEMFETISNISEFHATEQDVEDIFDSMELYFPLKYKEKDGPSKESLPKPAELANMLNAILSKPIYARNLIEASLLKFENETDIKHPTYELLAKAIPKYEHQIVSKYANELWTTIRIDSLKPDTDPVDEVASAALLTLTKIVKVLAADTSSLESLLAKIWSDLEICLKLKDINMSRSAVRIFLACSVNAEIFGEYFEKSYPHLQVSISIDGDDQGQCKKALLPLFDFLTFCSDKKFQCKDSILEELFDRLVERKMEKDVDTQVLVIDCLDKLINLHHVESAKIDQLAEYFMTLAVDYQFDSNICESIFKLVVSLAKGYEEDCFSKLFEPLSIEIADAFNSLSAKSDYVIFGLNVLKFTTHSSSMAESLITFSMDKLTKYFKDQLYNESRESIMEISLETLNLCLTRHCADSQFVEMFYNNCINILFDRLVHYIGGEEEKQVPSFVWKHLDIILATFLSNVASVASIRYPKLIEQFNSLHKLSNDDLSIFAVADTASVKNKLNEQFSRSQFEFVLFVLYSFVRSKLDISPSMCLDIFNSARSLMLNDVLVVNIPLQDSIFQLLCSILYLSFHRLASSQDVYRQIASTTLEEISTVVGDSQRSPELKALAVKYLIWMCKSLAKISPEMFGEYLQCLLCISPDESMVFNEITYLVKIITNNEDLGDQQAKSEYLPELHDLLVARFSETNDSQYLILCLANMSSMSDEQLASIDERRVGLIFIGLGHDGSTTLHELSLPLATKLVQKNPKLVETYAESLFKRLAKLAQTSESVAIRMASLELASLAFDLFSEATLVIIKEACVRDFRPTLDDHKRVVRAKAVKVVCKFHMIGQPGNRR